MNTNNPSIIGAAIVIAGMLIAGAVYFKPAGIGLNDNAALVEQNRQSLLKNLKPVGPDDWVRGSSNASIKIIEYSDLECPFCKTFHQTMLKIMKQYGVSGQVAWIYRHFPMQRIHSQAQKEAEAAECAGELGGSEKFFAYIDRVFEITPSNNRLDLNLLPQIAQEIGLNQEQFNECLSSGRTAGQVDADLQNGIAIGAKGTPFSVLLGPDKEVVVIPGALPFETIQEEIERILAAPQ